MNQNDTHFNSWVERTTHTLSLSLLEYVITEYNQCFPREGLEATLGYTTTPLLS